MGFSPSRYLCLLGLFIGLLTGCKAPPLNSLASQRSDTRGVTVTDLVCEYQVNPMGIDVARPRLSWKIAADRRAVLQAAYQIHCAESPQSLETGKDLLRPGPNCIATVLGDGWYRGRLRQISGAPNQPAPLDQSVVIVVGRREDLV